MDYRKIINKGIQIYPSIISRRAAIANQQANPLGYQELAITSGLGIGHTRALGKALGLIAASCHVFHLPPVNSTVLLKGQKKPGKGIDLATGCSLKNCEIDFKQSIKCNKYPQQLNITIPDPKKPYRARRKTPAFRHGDIRREVAVDTGARMFYAEIS